MSQDVYHEPSKILIQITFWRALNINPTLLFYCWGLEAQGGRGKGLIRVTQLNKATAQSR